MILCCHICLRIEPGSAIHFGLVLVQPIGPCILIYGVENLLPGTEERGSNLEEKLHFTPLMVCDLRADRVAISELLKVVLSMYG